MTNKSAFWNRIPAELRSLRQWCIAGTDKAPLTVDHTGKLNLASVNEPSHWMSFAQAAYYAAHLNMDVGFMLHEEDPYVCIDLDVKDAENCPNKPEKWTKPENYELYYRIMLAFDSFTETSRSGKGMHIWLRGKIGRGVRRDGIEVYSQERFIICTGKLIQDKPIRDQHVMLMNMVSQMMPPINERLEALQEIEPIVDDWYILQTALTANNGEKFLDLWRGNWHKAEYNYPSQSEADLSLMSMLTFYSDSNEQCRRLFRTSGLGQREKAVKNDTHLNRMLVLIRERQLRERSVELRMIQMAAEQMLSTRNAVQEEVARMQGGVSAANNKEVKPLHVVGQGEPVLAPPPVATAAVLAGPTPAVAVMAGATGLAWPPGLVGHLAYFIYQNAPRPIKEVAIVAALGLMAGICGKAWHIPQSGLNLYIILIGRSAIGKEAMHSGLSALIRAWDQGIPGFRKFINFSEFKSSSALSKAFTDNSCFVNVSGEWGRTMRRMSVDAANDAGISTLRSLMTSLYQKSGPQNIVGGMAYSDAEKNVSEVSGVAYSLIGETTPQTLYSSLTPSMMEDGFLSRFVMVSYEGDRPPLNRSQTVIPSDVMSAAMAGLVKQADTNLQYNTSIMVNRSEAAAKVMDEFEEECDKVINGTDNEMIRQMWNRASLKAMRIAALLAVGSNCMTPCIDLPELEWAIGLIRKDIEIMTTRINEGDIGSSDVTRLNKLVSVLREYLAELPPNSYKVKEEMWRNGIITRTYLYQRTSNHTVFLEHKLGHRAALDQAITSALDNGYLMDVPKDKGMEAFNHAGKMYRVVHLPERI